MSLDSLDGIREWRDRLAGMDSELIAVKSDTMAALLGVIFAEIDRLHEELETGRSTRGKVETVFIGKRRQLRGETPREGPDLLQ